MIGIAVNLSQLCQATRPGSAPHAITARLTQRDGSKYLAFSMEVVRSVGMTVNYDVPVRVLAGSELVRHQEPQLPAPTVRTSMPEARRLKALVDKLKALGSPDTRINASSSGTVTISSETETTSVEASYTGLVAAADGE